MAKLQKKRSSTPCLGICSTTFGDEVCKGCKRFSHEIVNWTKYSLEEREIINERIEKYKASLAEMKSVKKEKKKKTKTGEEPKVEKTPPAEEKK